MTPRTRLGPGAGVGVVALSLSLSLALVFTTAACSAPKQKPGAPYHHTTTGFRNPERSPERHWSWRGLPWILTRLIASFRDIEPPPNHVVSADQALAGLGAMKDRDTLT